MRATSRGLRAFGCCIPWRRHACSAARGAIVRTLKRAGKRVHAELLEQLTVALAPRLVPEVSSVRRAIEYLIDKEFVARHDADREIYVYVP